MNVAAKPAPAIFETIDALNLEPPEPSFRQVFHPPPPQPV